MQPRRLRLAECTSPKTYSSLSQGDHTFRVQAIDASGLTDTTPATRSWSVDTLAPGAPAITSPQDNDSVSASFTLSGTAEPNATVEIFEGTTSKGMTQASGSGIWSMTLASVSEGIHTYTARATDAAGNTSSASDARTLTFDATAPDTTIDSGPSGTVNDRSATFTFSSSEANSSFQCSLDSSSFSSCPSPVGEPQKANYSNLSEGSHTFSVRAIDSVRNRHHSAQQDLEGGHHSTDSRQRLSGKRGDGQRHDQRNGYLLGGDRTLVASPPRVSHCPSLVLRHPPRLRTT